MIDVVVQIPEEVAAPRENPKRRRSADAPLSAEQTVRILRARYPDALICVDRRCVTPLIATQRKSYALSRPVVTEQRRLSFVCARCRQDAAERERVRQQRAENLARNLGRQEEPASVTHFETRPAARPIEEEEETPRSINDLPSEMSDAERGEAFPSRRKRGRKPGDSRQARYRRRHPERAAFELKRLRRAA